jgi:hypothetical protein
VQFMKRINANLTDEQLAALRQRQIEMGVPIAEQIRRAVNLLIFSDAKPREVEYRKSRSEQGMFPAQESEA